MLPRQLLPLAALTLLFTACSTIREGVVLEKGARAGMEIANAYETGLSFRYRMPDVYWVRIEGLDKHGRLRRQGVILFRRDWEQLRVGDHWSRERGFSPAEVSDK